MSENDLKEKDASNKILSLVSHKLKTPLSIINGYSEAILSQAGKEKFSPFTSKALEEINKQGLKMGELVDKLLNYNKISSMKPIDLKKTDINLKTLVKECASHAIAKDDDSAPAPTTEPTAKRGTYIEIDCSERLNVHADKEILKAMLEEMLDNAIKFNNKMEKIIKLQCANHGNTVSISVRESLGRTINTTLTTLVTIVTLYILGVDTIREFSLPIIVGILAGAYSANLINGYVWAALEELRLARKGHRKLKAKKA